MKKNISALILVSLIFIGCTDTSLEVVDFSIADKPAPSPSKDFNELRNAYLAIFTFIQDIHSMHTYLVRLLLPMMLTDMQKVKRLSML